MTIPVPLSGEPVHEPHPLLSSDELALMGELELTADGNLIKLREALWRLAKLKVSEGFFPKYVAVIDDGTLKAFACRLAEKAPVGRGRLVWDGAKTPTEHCTIFSTALECGPHDLFLLARPCIRIAESVTPEARSRLTDLGNLCVTVENLPVRAYDSSEMYMTPLERSDVHHHIWRGPLVDFLADGNGYGVHRQPSVLKVLGLPIPGTFSSGTLDEKCNAHPADLGIFLANGTIVSVDLSYPILANEVVTLDTGLVMARYSATPAE